MSENKLIQTFDLLYTTNTAFTLKTQYVADSTNYLFAFISEHTGNISNIFFNFGELGYVNESAITSMNLNSTGELIITDITGDPNRFSIDSDGYLIETI